MSKSIWSNLNFNEKKQKSAYDYLLEQSNDLVEATRGELIMQVEAIDAYIDEEMTTIAALYILYIVAPKLGSYRKKVLTVADYQENSRFPVDIVCHIDKSPKLTGIAEENFIANIEKILSKPFVKLTIENLYKQSKELSKNDS